MSLTQLLIYFTFIGLFAGALWQPIFGILSYLAVYLIYNPETWWGKSLQYYLPRPSFLAMFVLILGSLIHLGKLDWSFSRREFELYLFIGFIWLSSFVFGIGVQDSNWEYLMKMTKLFVFIFFLLRIVDSLHDYKLTVWMFILGILFLAYQAHTVSASHFYNGRLDSLGGMDFGEANGLAAISAVAVLFAGIEMLRVRGTWKKIPYIIGATYIMHTIILTQSRGVFVGLLVTIPYFFLWAPSRYRKIIGIFSILGIVLFLTLINSGVIRRMDTISDELNTDQEETLTRLDIYKTSIRIVKDHPFGIGIKNFEKLVREYNPRIPGKDGHSTYLMCCSEIGIQGIVLFLIIIVEAFLQLRRTRLMAINFLHDEDLSLYVLALGGVLVVYLTGYGMTHTALYKEIFWILLSLPICLEHISQKLLLESEAENENKTWYSPTGLPSK